MELQARRDNLRRCFYRQIAAGSKGQPTLVMLQCGKLRALPPCAVGGFMSNIKVFPNGHASRLAVRAKFNSGRRVNLNSDSLTIYRLNIVLE